MNKEQAKNIVKDFNKQIKDYGEDLMPEEKELSQALDIAIEQMENDNLLERLENGKCKKHSSNKVVAYNRDYLDENLEMEFDLLKFARDTTSKMSDDELAERLSKVAEPYVRSEENE